MRALNFEQPFQCRGTPGIQKATPGRANQRFSLCCPYGRTSVTGLVVVHTGESAFQRLLFIHEFGTRHIYRGHSKLRTRTVPKGVLCS